MIRATETDTSGDQESSEGSAGGESTVQHMMKHLEDARNRRKREKDGNRCGNCRTVTGSTDVTVEERSDGRDLHYCNQCGRLLSTKEYRRWKSEHRW